MNQTQLLHCWKPLVVSPLTSLVHGFMMQDMYMIHNVNPESFTILCIAMDEAVIPILQS